MKQFGAKIDKEHLAIFEQSPNWKDGKFQNLEETTMNFTVWDVPEMIYTQLFNNDGIAPKQALPIQAFDKEEFLKNDVDFKCIWFGHSVVLMRLNGKTILIDPMLGQDAAPISPTKNKRFSKNTLDLIDAFPPIDLVIISHDHYDHLDLNSIDKLKEKTAAFNVALGVKRHLVKWGIDEKKITEFDWWNEKLFDGIQITFTPSRHFAGRGLTDRAKSFWGGWAFKTANHKIWFSGDGGYGKHFKTIGEKLGPFDLAFMECGQYNEKWDLIHMFPEQTVQAAIDAGAKKAFPIHWSGFSLAPHDWYEPADRFVAAAEEAHFDFTLPQLGEIITLTHSIEKKWWEQYRIEKKERKFCR